MKACEFRWPYAPLRLRLSSLLLVMGFICLYADGHHDVTLRVVKTKRPDLRR